MTRIAVVGPASPRAFSTYLGVAAESMPMGMGGVPVTSLVQALVDRGHQVHLVTASSELTQTWHCTGDRLGVSVVPYRGRARDRARDLFRREIRGVAEALGAQPHEVVHAHWTYEFALAALTRSEPVVVTAHDAPLTVLKNLPDAYRTVRLMMAIRTRRRTRHLTAVSPYLATRWRREMAYRRPIDVIPNISPFPPQRSHVRPPGVRIIDITDASRRKNVRTLLQAFASVREQVTDAELTLIGGGLDAGGALAEAARSDGLADGVRFLGQVDRARVATELSAASLMVHSSLEESQPMCLLEGLAWGIPVLAGRDAGGSAWTLDDGAAGTLVDVKDPLAISEAVMKAAENPDFDPEPGWRLLGTRYSADAVAHGYEQAYDAAVRDHHA